MITPEVTLDHIVAATSIEYGIPPRILVYRHRNPKAVEARHVVMWLARDMTELSLRQIALPLTLQDHSSVWHGCTKIDERLPKEPALLVRVEKVRRQALALAGSPEAALPQADPVAAAERVLLADRDFGAMRVSVDEAVAMATRLVALEEVAADTYRLLCLLQEYEGCRGRPRATDLRTSILALGDGLAEQLDALGYEVAEADATEPTPDQETARDHAHPQP